MGQNVSQISHGRFIATREDRRRFRRADRMLEGHSDSRASAAGSATTHGVNHHEHGALSGCENTVDLGWRPGFFNAVLRKVRPHGGDQVLRVCHGSILAAAPGPCMLSDSETPF